MTTSAIGSAAAYEFEAISYHEPHRNLPQLHDAVFPIVGATSDRPVRDPGCVVGEARGEQDGCMMAPTYTQLLPHSRQKRRLHLGQRAKPQHRRRIGSEEYGAGEQELNLDCETPPIQRWQFEALCDALLVHVKSRPFLAGLRPHILLQHFKLIDSLYQLSSISSATP